MPGLVGSGRYLVESRGLLVFFKNIREAETREELIAMSREIGFPNVVKPVVATGAEPPLPPDVAAGTPVWFCFTRSRRPICQASGAGPRLAEPAPYPRLLRFIRT